MDRLNILSLNFIVGVIAGFIILPMFIKPPNIFGKRSA